MYDRAKRKRNPDDFYVSPTVKQPQGIINFHFASSAWRGQSQTALRIRASQLHPQMDPQELSKDANEFLQMRSCFKNGKLMGLSENSGTATEFPRYFSDGQRTHFQQTSSTQVAGPYFKDIFQLLNKCNHEKHNFPLKSPSSSSLTKHLASVLTILCLLCIKTSAFLLILFSRVTYIFSPSQHKELKQCTYCIFLHLSYSPLRYLLLQLLTVWGLQSCGHWRTVQKAYCCTCMVVSPTMQ